FQLAWHLAEVVRPGGSLWLQSYYPEHPALEAVALGARECFYEPEWAERRELGYPPARRMARIVAEGGGAAGLAAGLSVRGPARRGGGRAELLLLGGDELPLAVAGALGPLRGRRQVGAVRLTVEVDPVEL